MIGAFTAGAVSANNSKRVGATKSYGLLYERLGALRVITVILVLFALVCLAMLDKLNDGIIGILASVAGYAFGGLQSNQSSKKDDGTHNKSEKEETSAEKGSGQG